MGFATEGRSEMAQQNYRGRQIRARRSRRIKANLPCQCGRQLDIFGSSRAACAVAVAAAQVCREVGALVSTNFHVRTRDLDGRRLEVVTMVSLCGKVRSSQLIRPGESSLACSRCSSVFSSSVHVQCEGFLFSLSAKKVLESAQASDPEARVWKGSGIPTAEQ